MNLPTKIKFSTFQFVAPFFSCWFCTGWTSLFFPLYFIIKIFSCNKSNSFGNNINYHHLNFSKSLLFSYITSKNCFNFPVESLLLRCVLFCLMSVLTNYLYIKALQVLDCTVVTALFATNASFVYLLSWVILKQQFVGNENNDKDHDSISLLLFPSVRYPNRRSDPEHHGHLVVGLHGEQPRHPRLGGAGHCLGRGDGGL